MATQTEPYSFDLIDAGVDWITCTARGKAARGAFKAQGEALLHEEAARGVEITPSRLRDYDGWRCPGLFVGGRRDDDLVVMSATRAAASWHTIAQHATNVSRLDLQATVWTHGEQPALSRWYYQRLKRLPPKPGRPRNLSLIQSHPQGDTLYVGKRQSDCFGRVYDYAAAHDTAPARTVWRYEVEFKRDMALRHCRALSGVDDRGGHAASVVGSWFETRGVRKTWTSHEFSGLQNVYRGETERDVLSWFRTSLSKTIARAIKHNGVVPVFDALGLSQYLIDSRQEGGTAYAYNPEQALQGDSGRRPGRATDHDNVLAQGAHSQPGQHSRRGDKRHPSRDD